MPSTPPYPEEFRREAVALVRSSEKSIPVLAAELGVSPQSHRNWSKQTELDAGERRDGLRSDERCASALSASDFLGRESGDGVDFGLGEADALGGEVPMEVLDAGGAGDRERSGGAVKLPGERDLLRRDVVFGGDRVDHRVKRRAFGAVGNGGGVPGGEDDAGLLGDPAD